MRKVLPLLALISLFSISCSEAENGNQDSASEVACTSATGVWVISAATCDGSAVSDLGNISFTFNSSTSLTQGQGTSSCASSMNWDIVLGASDNSLSMTGNGTLTCSASGSSVANCSSGTNNCNNMSDITGHINNFETCAISGSTMTLIRTVSSTNNPNNNSYCADGAAEQITLTQAATNPTGPAVLAITGANPVDFGSVGTGGNSNITLTVVNNGGETATSISGSGLAAPFSFLGGAYPGTGGDCGATLASTATCSIVVQFSPTVAGAANDSVLLDYNDSAAAQQLSHDVTGTGVNGSLAVLTISGADPYDYGALVVGASGTNVFTVSNTGTGTASAISEVGLATPFRFTGGAYPGTAGTCTASLAPAASCTVEVEFAPVIVGVSNDSISLSYNDGTNAQSVDRNLTGTGVAPALLVISNGPTYDFGNVQVGFTSNQLFTVTNTGGFFATGMFGIGLAAPFSFRGGGYPGVGGTCGSTLAPGANCTIDVEFSPTVIGFRLDTINLLYNDGVAAQQANRDVVGNGMP